MSAQGSKRITFKMPEKCPVCGGKVVREEGEAAPGCICINCPGRLKESILHFAARGVMNIDGVGGAGGSTGGSQNRAQRCRHLYAHPGRTAVAGEDGAEIGHQYLAEYREVEGQSHAACDRGAGNPLRG